MKMAELMAESPDIFEELGKFFKKKGKENAKFSKQ